MGRGERLHTHTHIEYMGTYHQPLNLLGVEKREKDPTSADTRGLENERERERSHIHVIGRKQRSKHKQRVLRGGWIETSPKGEATNANTTPTP